MKKLVLIFFFSILGICYGINNFEIESNFSKTIIYDTIITYKTDTLSNLILKTIFISRPRKFIGIKLNHKKDITIDMIYSGNELIMKTKSKFISSNDASTTIKFNRIKLQNGKILKYKFPIIRNHGKKIEYNLKGNRINTQRLKADLLINDYVSE